MLKAFGLESDATDTLGAGVTGAAFDLFKIGSTSPSAKPSTASRTSSRTPLLNTSVGVRQSFVA